MKHEIIDGKSVITLEKGEQVSLAFNNSPSTLDISENNGEISLKSNGNLDVTETISEFDAYERWLKAFDSILANFTNIAYTYNHKDLDIKICINDGSIYFNLVNRDGDLVYYGAKLNIPNYEKTYDYRYVISSIISMAFNIFKDETVVVDKQNFSCIHKKIKLNKLVIFDIYENESNLKLIDGYFNSISLCHKLNCPTDQYANLYMSHISKSNPANQRLLEYLAFTELQCDYFNKGKDKPTLKRQPE